jgi:hypothetical protein
MPSRPAPSKRESHSAARVRSGGGRGQMDRRLHRAEGILEGCPPAGEGSGHVIDLVQGEQVEGDQPGRGLGGQQGDPAGRGMDAQQQGVEVQPPALRIGDHDLGVDHTAGRQVGLHGLDDLGEVPGHGPLPAAAQLDLVAVAEHDRPEPVPLGLEAPGPIGQPGDRLGQHRRHRRHHRKIHTPSIQHSAVVLMAGARSPSTGFRPGIHSPSNVDGSPAPPPWSRRIAGHGWATAKFGHSVPGAQGSMGHDGFPTILLERMRHGTTGYSDPRPCSVGVPLGQSTARPQISQIATSG